VATDHRPRSVLLPNPGVDLAEWLRGSMQWLLQRLMEAEVSRRIGADKHQRTSTRTNQRNGCRPPVPQTRPARLQRQIPKLRKGSDFPAFLHPRLRSEPALAQVIPEAYVLGVSTRKVDELVQALGMTGIRRGGSAVLPPSGTTAYRPSATVPWMVGSPTCGGTPRT